MTQLDQFSHNHTLEEITKSSDVYHTYLEALKEKVHIRDGQVNLLQLCEVFKEMKQKHRLPYEKFYLEAESKGVEDMLVYESGSKFVELELLDRVKPLCVEITGMVSNPQESLEVIGDVDMESFSVHAFYRGVPLALPVSTDTQHIKMEEYDNFIYRNGPKLAGPHTVQGITCEQLLQYIAWFQLEDAIDAQYREIGATWFNNVQYAKQAKDTGEYYERLASLVRRRVRMLSILDIVAGDAMTMDIDTLLREEEQVDGMTNHKKQTKRKGSSVVVNSKLKTWIDPSVISETFKKQNAKQLMRTVETTPTKPLPKKKRQEVVTPLVQEQKVSVHKHEKVKKDPPHIRAVEKTREDVSATKPTLISSLNQLDQQYLPASLLELSKNGKGKQLFDYSQLIKEEQLDINMLKNLLEMFGRVTISEFRTLQEHALWFQWKGYKVVINFTNNLLPHSRPRYECTVPHCKVQFNKLVQNEEIFQEFVCSPCLMVDIISLTLQCNTEKFTSPVGQTSSMEQVKEEKSYTPLTLMKEIADSGFKHAYTHERIVLPNGQEVSGNHTLYQLETISEVCCIGVSDTPGESFRYNPKALHKIKSSTLKITAAPTSRSRFVLSIEPILDEERGEYGSFKISLQMKFERKKPSKNPHKDSFYILKGKVKLPEINTALAPLGVDANIPTITKIVSGNQFEYYLEFLYQYAMISDQMWDDLEYTFNDEDMLDVFTRDKHLRVATNKIKEKILQENVLPSGVIS